MSTEQVSKRPLLRIRKTASHQIADVEYRVVWNGESQVWNVFRNGVLTDISDRKKKASAIASATRDAKEESERSGARIAVVCLEGRATETLWRSL